ncbi:Re/Si-specific NAD(P)(+) transhydrogenase subunit alpha [Aldersonia kunmingensis]|uniref:Re/Si-specific NAD(P)(+) transhydrogenase subunit alpha n=1 Tax=Aldersonia kunmingensis TaxID=408066 RepID=UPI00082A61D5|nr:Re/Si-specific NAD(P)(+) transhydrogenase subunit alpha [Aldersonia kunmingensis]
MIIGVVNEAPLRETRVAATPTTVAALLKLGYDVVVEPHAGAAASFADDAFADAGATVGSIGDADIVLSVNPLTRAQLDHVKRGATVIAILSPALRPDLVEDLARRPITALAMDAVPRISRAQSLDVLSSMANIAGYRAVIEAAHEFGRFFTGQVTAAGKVPPAKVLVVGAGVAGLAAIGAAGSLGAIVRATDPRPEVADQVRSLGGDYLPIVTADVEISATGYAKEMGDDYKALEAKLYADQARDVDIIITTALIPGRPAPCIITAEMVASMNPGSVIVDMAAQNGGNVEGTVKDETIVTSNGVKIIGYTNLASRLPAQASQLYATNLVNLIKLMTPEKDGQLVLDLDEVVQRSITVVHQGELTWPPPPVNVSAAPIVAATKTATPSTEKKTTAPAVRWGSIIGGLAAFFVVLATAPAPIPGHFATLMLSIVIGYYVIGHVAHALHTPLMSVTNAISGIIVIGALMQIGSTETTVTIVSAIAVLLASVNIFGGFAVTRRMLAMFNKGN